MYKPNKASKSFTLDFKPRPFSLMTKPAGPLCNLNCTYCYYLEKYKLYNDRKITGMPDSLLEEFVKQYIDSQPVSDVIFVWQGGEPCLAGIDFYKKALAFQRKYASGKHIENSFQTNGILINDEWCRFFHDNRFLVGISVDGPGALHDKYRSARDNSPTSGKVLKAIGLLKKYKVEFNTLTVVNNFNADHPGEIYSFLKSIGSHYMQFLPAVERTGKRIPNNGLQLLSHEERDDAVVTDWSVDSLKYGKFLTAIFDEWVKKDVGQYFVRMFDATLANWLGMPPGVCVMADRCGNAGVIEHNGDVYSCDHFVYPEYYLGNITVKSLKEIMNSVSQQIFGENKFFGLPGECKRCAYLTRCWGECPKNRILKSVDGEYGLNYLCEGLKHYFSHVTPAMEFMANEIKNRRSPANIMNLK